MDIHFLGAATTVTGSQFLVTTDRAQVLVDCGMFQGSPNEAIRNRVPLAYAPETLDAILLTHAHLDHCGLLPLIVKEGFRGPVYATAATAELTRLVLLDSGKLQEEFARRGARWERRNPERAAQEEIEDRAALELAVANARAGDQEQFHLRRRQTDLAGGKGQTPTRRAPLHSAALVVPMPDTVERPGPVPKRYEDIAAGMAIEAPNPEDALRLQPAAIEPDLDEPLYTVKDSERAIERFKSVRYDRELEVAPGIFATYLDAGHILGSAIIRLRIVEGRKGGYETTRTIVFSGDLGRRDTPILRDPTILTDADYVVVESTYGGREHEPNEEAIRILAETVRLVDQHDGVLLVPSFAIGRTQEIVWQLDRLLERGEIPELPLYLDSPMATRASDIYRRHPENYDKETARLLREQASPLDYPNQMVTNDIAQSRTIEHAPRPHIIVASNGMLTGGRVVGHLRRLIGDPHAMLLFVGYQGKGTLGAHLQAGAKRVKIEGQVYDVRLEVRSISGFSAHADESELLDWVGHFGAGKRHGDRGFPKTVFIVHGDPDAQHALEPKLRTMGFETLIPHWHQRVLLD